jgi:hypothetical protein
VTGQGTRDMGQEDGEGEAAAEPKTAASSEWRMVFLEGSAPALPKIFGTSGDVPSSFSACFSRLCLVDTHFSRWANQAR